MHYTALVLKTKHIIAEWEIMLLSQPDHEYKTFLANSSNEQALINLLGAYMANVDITVQQAEGDSDYKICTVACRSAQTGVIADYTDIFQSSLAIMLRVVSDIAYRRLKLSLQNLFKKLKTWHVFSRDLS